LLKIIDFSQIFCLELFEIQTSKLKNLIKQNFVKAEKIKISLYFFSLFTLSSHFV